MNDGEDGAGWLARAVALSRQSAAAGTGPFGAVIVLDGRLIGEGHNRVTGDCDPTAHAEVVAIRAACRALGRFALDGAVLYASCEPCPMCLAAVWWARISRVVHAATRHDAAAAGFDDLALYVELTRPLGERRLPLIHQPRPDALEVLSHWGTQPNQRRY